MSTDPFKDDPLCKALDDTNRRNSAKNWSDARKRYNAGMPDLENPGICHECGSDQISHDGLNWYCSECGIIRFAVRRD